MIDIDFSFDKIDWAWVCFLAICFLVGYYSARRPKY